MLPFSECKRTLNDGTNNYTDEEIKQIIDFIYRMAKIQIEYENNNIK